MSQKRFVVTSVTAKIIRMNISPWIFFSIVAIAITDISCQSAQYSERDILSQFPSIFTRSINSTSAKTIKQICSAQKESAVVLMYHKFDEPYKSTSVRLEQFMDHMEYLRTNGFTVVPLSKVVAAAKDLIPFEKKWIAITIDDAYKSFLKAKPILEAYKYPYTVFVNTQAVDEKYSNYMTWSELKNIARSHLGSLESHSHTHSYLVRGLSPQERKIDILLSVKKIYTHTNQIPRFLAYPFGETSLNLIQEIQNYNQVIIDKHFNFSAAFATQSGPVGCSSDLYALPRFTMNEQYGKIDSLFKIKLNSRHLPIYDYYPKNKSLCIEQKIQRIYFSTNPYINLKNLRCFASRGNSANVYVNKGLVAVDLEKPFGFGLKNTKDVRERVNCTLHHNGRYFWYGREFTILKDSPECRPLR